MKLVWLCNMIPGALAQHLGLGSGGGLWIDHVLEDIRAEDITLRLFCPGTGDPGRLDERTDYVLFSEGAPQVYLPQLEAQFARELEAFRPDVIHIWGTEFGHTLAMVNAAKRTGLLDRVVVSIQGLCGIYARHYAEGLPEWVCRRYSLRDLLKWDDIRDQKRRFAQRGELESAALKQVRHILGRTDWDRAITGQLRPDRVYHFCNETLREPFYRDTWRYDRCTKHQIFASSCIYPIKGFHYLLEAMPLVLRRFPDAAITVTGSSFFSGSMSQRLRQTYYRRYLERLACERGLQDKIRFLGRLDAGQMKAAYLDANVFVLPSTIENSPNSLGEAMLLGVPCVAADVGGVRDLMHTGEGFAYQSTAPYMLAEYILEVFDRQEQAQEMGARARAHALQTHDPERNLKDLLKAYGSVAKGEK